MNLTCKDIRAIAHGALSVTQNEEGEVVLHRFNERQMQLYKTTDAEFYRKAHATSGIRLEFTTNASFVELSYHTKYASSRRFYYFDVFVDDVMTQHFGHEDVAEVKSTLRVELPEGTHKVKLVFPNLAEARICSLLIEDGASLTPVQKKHKLLCLGDSITQGYDAKYSSQSYANLLADKLDAEMIDQAIGGEVFRPELVGNDLSFTPDIITVAYGTNDWSGRTRERTESHSAEFYARLRTAFPKAKIFAITPIWRADDHRVTKVGTFEQGRQLVRDAANAVNAVIVEGDGMIPHLPEVCSDLYLHPNDFGFKFYANALYNAMLPHLSEKE